MKVIGSGLPRTGTLSQKVALEMLGYGPCYHMVNVLADLNLANDWSAAVEGDADWDTVFSGFESTIDWPGSRFYAELLEHFPDAKVLHSVRDPERWEQSMRETVWGIVHGSDLIGYLSNARALVEPSWASYLDMIRAIGWNEDTGQLARDHATKDGLIAAFNAHTEAVKATVPADQLLIYDVTEGWEPLCEFLEVDVPEAPFPHVNDGVEFKRRIVGMSVASLNTYWDDHGGDVTGATAARTPAVT